MRIKIYIVTYNDPRTLHANLSSLFATDLSGVSVNVINNHSNFHLDESFKDKVKVLHNQTRPDFSRGHLARNWNEAIINGFRDLKSPDCDILVTCQDDSVWKPTWKEELIDIHKTYSFYTCGWGDGLCSYTPDAVKTIGLWDERFNGISYQEADYFLRAYLHNYEKSSINDRRHTRTLNPTHDVINRPEELANNARPHNGREYVIVYTRNFFVEKWGIQPDYWNHAELEHKILRKDVTPKLKEYVLYPYFEKDIQHRPNFYR